MLTLLTLLILLTLLTYLTLVTRSTTASCSKQVTSREDIEDRGSRSMIGIPLCLPYLLTLLKLVNYSFLLYYLTQHHLGLLWVRLCDVACFGPPKSIGNPCLSVISKVYHFPSKNVFWPKTSLSMHSLGLLIRILIHSMKFQAKPHFSIGKIPITGEGAFVRSHALGLQNTLKIHA